MAGSLGKAGEAGTESGRLDLFLDRGQYKLRIESAEKGTGKVKIQAQSFREKRGGALAAVPRLVETRLVQERLDDLEQVSYWVEIGERTRGAPGGRRPQSGRPAPVAGRLLARRRRAPLPADPAGRRPAALRCRLSALLEPGLYLLTAYGGSRQPWAEGSDEHPFYLRWGEPRLPATGRRRYVVSPFGEDHFRLPDNVNFLRLELPEARPPPLGAGWLRGGSAYEQATDTASGAVTKESLPPAVEVRVQSKPSEERQESGGAGELRPRAPAEPAPEEAAAEAPAGDEGMSEAAGAGGRRGDGEGNAGGEEAPPPEAAEGEPAPAKRAPRLRPRRARLPCAPPDPSPGS